MPSFRRSARDERQALLLLGFLGALSLMLMTLDARWHTVSWLRSAITTPIYPLQSGLAALRAGAERWRARYEGTSALLAQNQNLQEQLAQAQMRAAQAEALQKENERLSALLQLPAQTLVGGRAARLLSGAEPLNGKVLLDAGARAGVQLAAAVGTSAGIIGQVTQVYPYSAEVSLLTGAAISVPAVNARSHVRGISYGDVIFEGEALEVRFVALDADVALGDLWLSSGLGGVFPAGAPLARTVAVEKPAGSLFLRVLAKPLARMDSADVLWVFDLAESLTRTNAAAAEIIAPLSAPSAATRGKSQNAKK